MYTETNPKTGQPVFKTNLKVIYIDSSPDLSTKLYSQYEDFMDSVLADALGFTQTSFSAQRVHLSPANVYIIGYDEENLPNEYDQLINLFVNHSDLFARFGVKTRGFRTGSCTYRTRCH